MAESDLTELIGDETDAAGILDQLGVRRPGDLAGHWAVKTPQGRAWLVDRAGVREAQVLQWGFASELVGLFEAMGLDLEPRLAWNLVRRGVTLHTIRTLPAEELAARASGELEWYGVGLAPTWFEKLQSWLAKKGAALQTIEYYDLLVVSDFHLAAGNRPSREGLARLSPTEDFFFDDAFFRFLVHCEQERRARQGYPYELVFNGDMVDFVQVVARAAPDRVDWWFLENALPPDPSLREGAGSTGGIWQAPRDAGAAPAGPPAGPGERLWDILDDVYQDEQVRGFEEERARRDERDRAAAREQRKAAPVRPREVLSLARPTALEQLRDVCQGHRRFFQGLAWFLACGNRLVLMRGNHDMQWYWPEVQIALLGWLRAAYDELVQESQRPGAAHSLPVPPEELRLPGPGGALPPLPVDELDRRVDFDHAWYYYRDRLAYLEHGGQHEAVDTHRHFLAPVYSPEGDGSGEVPAASPPGPTLDELKDNPPQRATDWLPDLAVVPGEKEIDPAVGSLGNVFLINNLEIELPNFERPGYNKIYLPWLLYHQPGVLLRKLLGALRRLLKFWFEWARRERRMLGHQLARRQAYARLTGLSEECARELDETPWVRRWRRSASGWFYALLLVVSVGVPVVLAFLLVLGVSEKLPDLLPVAGWLRSWLPDPVQDFVGISGPSGSETLPMWDLFSGLFKTLAFGFLSYWGATLLRDWIGLGEDYLYGPSSRVAGILKKYGYDVPYLLFGHDHARNAQAVDLGAGCYENGCIGQLRKWGFLPGRWRDRLQPWKWRWHVRLDRGRIKASSIECPHCRRPLKAKALRRQIVGLLREQEPGWPPIYLFTCPHCGQVNAGDPLTDLDFEKVDCKGCGKELSWQDVEKSPSLWTTARDLGLNCVECGKALPNEILDGIRIYPHTVDYCCPTCGGAGRQWLRTWHLRCPNPDCGKKPGKWDLELTEAGSLLRCSCNTLYSRLPPPRRWYLNTGTWMHFYATERKRLVREVLEYPFVRLIETDAAVTFEPEWHDPEGRLMARVELLRWNDAARRFEACETFQGAAEP